jgi:hypothetical protein
MAHPEMAQLRLHHKKILWDVLCSMALTLVVVKGLHVTRQPVQLVFYSTCFFILLLQLPCLHLVFPAGSQLWLMSDRVWTISICVFSFSSSSAYVQNCSSAESNQLSKMVEAAPTSRHTVGRAERGHGDSKTSSSHFIITYLSHSILYSFIVMPYIP